MKYLKYSLLFILICGAALYAIFFLYRTGYNRYYNSEIEALNEKLNGTAYHDLVFLGSSRTYMGINPKVIDSVTGLDTYNAGIMGAKFLEMNMVLQCYLKTRKPPKLLLLEMPPAGFDPDQRPIFNPNIYYPFLENDIVYRALKPFHRVWLFKHLPFSQLTEADDDLRQGALSGLFGQKSKAANFYKGYRNEGNDTIRLPFRQTYFNVRVPVTDKDNKYLKEIIQTCKERSIKVVVIYPPVYKYIQEQPYADYFPTVEKICAANNLPFLNYWDFEHKADHTIFTDQIHLNSTGTHLFSAMLANDVMNLPEAATGLKNAYPTLTAVK